MCLVLRSSKREVTLSFFVNNTDHSSIFHCYTIDCMFKKTNKNKINPDNSDKKDP